MHYDSYKHSKRKFTIIFTGDRTRDEWITLCERYGNILLLNRLLEFEWSSFDYLTDVYLYILLSKTIELKFMGL